jgi:hypothetical protein
MKSKHIFLTALTVLWVFFIIVDKSAGLIAANRLLYARRPFGIVAKALRSSKGVAIFLLIIANIFLVLKPVERSVKKR